MKTTTKSLTVIWLINVFIMHYPGTVSVQQVDPGVPKCAGAVSSVTGCERGGWARIQRWT